MEISREMGFQKPKCFKGNAHVVATGISKWHEGGMGLKLKTFHGRGMVVSGTTPYNFKIAFSIYCIRDSTLSSLETGTCI